MEYTTGSRIIDDVQPMRDLDVTRSSRDNGVRTFDEVKKKNSRADKNIRHKKGKTLNNSTITMSAVMLKSSFYLLFRR